MAMAFVELYTEDNSSSLSSNATGPIAFRSVVATNAHMVVATTEAPEYSKTMVRAILKAENAPATMVPADEKGFMDWFNDR